MSHAISIHPSIDNGIVPERANFAGGTLSCACATHPVKIRIKGQIAHNHACGCTKCWKPEGANFSVVAVAPTENVTVLENGDKLAVVDASALIQRHACKECGVHMHGPVEREHAFKGLSFIHPERFEEKGWAVPGFAAFVSSIIEAGGAGPDERRPRPAQGNGTRALRLPGARVDGLSCDLDREEERCSARLVDHVQNDDVFIRRASERMRGVFLTVIQLLCRD